jgi:hypothetical protein
MPSARDCADRLREQAYKTLLPQIQDLEEELRQVSSLLSTGVHQIERKLEALRHIELPATELVLDEVLGEVIQRRDLEASALALFARELRQKETQEEILNFLLDSAVHYYPRIALFVVRGERFIGWSSRGFSESAARSIGSDSFDRSEYPQFQQALKGSNSTTITDLPERDSLLSIQKDSLSPWQLFPLYVLQRPVAFLLAAGAEGIACRPDAISLLMDLTAQRLENVALKLLYELNMGNSEAAAPAMPAETISAPMSAAEPATMKEEALEVPLATEPEYIEKPVPNETESAFDMESAHETDHLAEPVASQGVNDWTANGYDTSNPKTEFSSIAIETSMPIPDEEKLHTDAKRFARLLVSEIKLYNENPVAEGRQNGDLYLRLKRDIDRSREMYEKRISPIVARKIDYFHDEIVRILGDNDFSTLGSDYPGPRIES